MNKALLLGYLFFSFYSFPSQASKKISEDPPLYPRSMKTGFSSHPDQHHKIDPKRLQEEISRQAPVAQKKFYDTMNSVPPGIKIMIPHTLLEKISPIVFHHIGFSEQDRTGNSIEMGKKFLNLALFLKSIPFADAEKNNLITICLNQSYGYCLKDQSLIQSQDATDYWLSLGQLRRWAATTTNKIEEAQAYKVEAITAILTAQLHLNAAPAESKKALNQKIAEELKLLGLAL